MKRKRRKFSAEFKARVALEAIKSQKTINQIAQAEGVLPVQVSAWKKELQERMPEGFQSGAKEREEAEKAERDRARLERKVGQLTIEKEFLEKKVRSARDRSERKAMIEPGHEKLSLRRQAVLLGINRNRLAVRAHPAQACWEEDQKALRELDRLHTRWPFYGQRKLLVEMRRAGVVINRKRLRRLMSEAGIAAVAPKRWTSQPQASHAKYPYLLRELKVEAADQVWCADITYIAMEKGHAYLVSVMDWHTRAVLSWQLSNTLDASFCLTALSKAVAVAGRAPGIFNTDQGCQFTGQEWITAVESKGCRVSMDGRGRWTDNVFIERLWRSLKCELIYLSSYDNLHELEAAITRWMNDYNHHRIHQTLGYTTPWENYRPAEGLATAA